MDYEITELSSDERRVSAVFSDSEVLAVWKKAASRFGGQFSMAGFRPGKAPLSVLEKGFGSQIAELATNILLGRVVDAVLQKEAPVVGFLYGGKNAVRGQEFRVEASFGILPEFSLPDIKPACIPVSSPAAAPVQEEQLLREILRPEARSSAIQEGTPQDGDLVSAEVTGRIDGQIVPGMKTGGCRIRLAPHAPGEKIPDLDPIIRRLHVGETGMGSTICPDNYPDPSLRGREIELTVTVRGIEREELPPVDDATARKLGFAGVRELEAHVHDQALALDMRRQQAGLRRAFLAQLEEAEQPEPPAFLTQVYFREIMRMSRSYMQKQYASPEALRESLSQMKKEAGQAAQKKARGRAVLLAWARQNGVTLAPEEVEAVIRVRAARQHMDPWEYRLGMLRTGELCELKTGMLAERALDMLLERHSASVQQG